MSLHAYRGITPRVDPTAFVALTAAVIGDVVVGASSSVWYGAVIRGDVMAIRIGARTSIQDNTVIHATGGWRETHVLAVVAGLADDVVVMRHGEVVESGPTREVFRALAHPYTRQLFEASAHVPPRDPSLPGGEPVLVVDGLVRDYRG